MPLSTPHANLLPADPILSTSTGLANLLPRGPQNAYTLEPITCSAKIFGLIGIQQKTNYKPNFTVALLLDIDDRPFITDSDRCDRKTVS